jgi:hypothetical protein
LHENYLCDIIDLEQSIVVGSMQTAYLLSYYLFSGIIIIH